MRRWSTTDRMTSRTILGPSLPADDGRNSIGTHRRNTAAQAIRAVPVAPISLALQPIFDAASRPPDLAQCRTTVPGTWQHSDRPDRCGHSPDRATQGTVHGSGQSLKSRRSLPQSSRVGEYVRYRSHRGNRASAEPQEKTHGPLFDAPLIRHESTDIAGYTLPAGVRRRRNGFDRHPQATTAACAIGVTPNFIGPFTSVRDAANRLPDLAQCRTTVVRSVVMLRSSGLMRPLA